VHLVDQHVATLALLDDACARPLFAADHDQPVRRLKPRWPRANPL
jgi:hypothetical protein